MQSFKDNLFGGVFQKGILSFVVSCNLFKDAFLDWINHEFTISYILNYIHYVVLKIIARERTFFKLDDIPTFVNFNKYSPKLILPFS